MKYSTEPKKYLLEFLKSHKDEQYTINEIISLTDNSVLHKSTLYRIIKQMVDEGTVKTFISDNGRKFAYHPEILCNSHLHLQCEACGRLLHIDDKTSEIFEKLIDNKYNFHVNQNKTLLFGKCENCK